MSPSVAVVVLVAVHRRVHGQVDRAGELDGAVIALVGGSVEVDVGALDVDVARGLHRVDVDLSAVDRQARQLGGAPDRTRQRHRSAVGIQCQRMTAVHRRTEGDGPVRAVVVAVGVDRDVAAQDHCPAERNIGVVDRDVALEPDRAARGQRQRAGQRNSIQGYVGAGDGQVGQRGRAADGTLKVHIAAAGVQRQRLGAVHRRGEGDVPVGRVVVLVAVHRRVHGQVDRAGELDGAVVALVGGSVEVDVGALDVDRTRGLHRVEVDLPDRQPSGWSAWSCRRPHPAGPRRRCRRPASMSWRRSPSR